MQDNSTENKLTDKKEYGKVKADYLNRIRWAVGLLYFAMGLCFASWASRIPDIKTSLGLTESDLGTVLFAIPFGQMAIMPFSGRIATKYGSHKTVIIGLVSYILCLIVLGLCTTRGQLSLSLFFFGIASNLTNISVNTQGIYTEGIFRRPIMSAFHGAWSMAGFIGALIGLGMVAMHATPFVHFVIVAILLFIVILANYKHLVKVKKQPLPKKRKLFNKPDTVLLWLGIMSFCCMLSEGVMFDWSGVYFKEVVQAPGALAVLGYASFMIMMALGRFLGDIAIRKLGRKHVLQLSGSLITFGLLSAVIFPYLITATLSFMMVGIGVSGVIPIIYSVAGKRPDIPPGIALQTISGVSFLGFMIGPPVTGFIAQATSLKVSFAIIAVFGVGIAVLATKVKAISES